MTRKRSSPLGLELLAPLSLAILLLPLLAQAAPLQDATEIQQYSEGCYYNYNHYNEGDRILTNEPCLNCTCHHNMLMCYLRMCPFTKPIGHDCIVEKREDQCCAIVTCPEVPVDVAHHAPEPGTELSIPEKYGCSIDDKFYPEGAQVPSNPNKPCELCYCIKNRTSCLMQECTLHIDGCTPIYNKGSCCPVRYNCDHENDVLELEDQSTTTTTVRPTPGFILATTMSPSVTTDCIHNGELYADGASISGKSACEHCYCMRGDIVCAVQECEMPMTASNGKSCHPMPPVEGECCPSNYVCEDDTDTTQIVAATTPIYTDESSKLTTIAPAKDIHSSIPDEDILLQEHIDDQERVTVGPDYAGDGKPAEVEETGSGDFDKTESDMEVDQAQTTTAPSRADYDILEASSTSAPAVSTTTDGSKIGVVEKVEAVTSGAPISITEEPLDVTTTNAFTEKESTEEKMDIDEGADQDTTKLPFETRIDVTSGSSDLSEPTVKPEEDGKEPKPAAEDEPHDEHVTTKLPFETRIDVTSGSSDLSEPTVKPEEDGKEPKPAAEDEPHDEELDIDALSEPAITEKDEHMIESSTTTASAIDKEEAAQTEEPIAETSQKEDKDKIASTEPTITDKKDDDIEPSTTIATPVDKKESIPTEASVEETSSEETTDKVTGEEPEITEKDSHAVEASSTIAAIVDKDAAAHTESSVAKTGAEEDKDESISTSEKEDSLVDSTGKPEIESTTTGQDEVIAGDSEVSTYKAPTDIDIEKESSTPASISPEKTETSAADSDKEEVSSEETGSESEEPSSTESIEDKESSHKPEKSSEESTEHEGEIDFHKPTESTDEQKPATSTEPSSSEKDEVEKTDKLGPTEEQSVDVDKATVPPTTEEQTIEVTTISSLEKKPTQDEPQSVVDESDHTTIPSIDGTTVLSSTSPPVHDETVDEVKPSSESIEDIGSTTAAAPSEDDHTTIKPEPSVEEVPVMALPAVIPGEGDCLVDQKTYENNTIVSSSDECETSCRCISSVVVCERIQCDVPENVEKCVVDEDSTNKCCPAYICGIDSAPSKPGSFNTSTEDEDEEISFTTLETPHKDIIEQVAPVDIEKEDETTAKLPTDEIEAEITTVMAPTDIIIPSVSTEQPMSHVKDETQIPDADGVSIVPRIDEFSTETPIISDVVKLDSADKPMHKPDVITTDDKYDHDESTKTPASEDKPSLGEEDETKQTQTPPSLAEEIEKKPLDTIDDYTVVPTIGDKMDEHIDEILSTTTPLSEVKKKTTLSYVGGEKKPTDTDETMAQTIAPSVDDSKTEDIDVTLSPTILPAHKDETSTDTPSSITASAVEDDEKEQVGDNQAQTIAPSIGGETESDEDVSSHTAAPSVEESEKEPLDEILAHITTPSVSEVEKEQTDKMSSPTFSPSTDKPEKQSIDESAMHTISPSVGEDETTETTDGKKKPSDEISGSTPASTIDEEHIDTTVADSVTPITVIEEGEKEKKPIDEILSHTTAAPIEEAEKDTTDEVSEHTGAPSIDEHDEKPVDESLEHTELPSVTNDEEKLSEETFPHTIAPTTEEKEEKPTDALSTSTTVPTITESEEKPVDEMHTTVSSIAEDEKETTDKISVQTVRPSTEQGEKTRIDESIPPSTEDVSDVDVVAQTIAPTVQEEKEDYDKDISKPTDQPALPDIQEVSTDSPLAHTIAPTEVEKDTPDELLTHTVSPTVETPQKEPIDEVLAHTDTPSEEEGSLEEATTARTILPLEKLDVSKTDEEHKEDALEHTEIPSATDDKHEPLDEILVQTDSPTDAKNDGIDDIASQTIAPTLADGKKEIIVTTDVPSVGVSKQEPSTEVKGEHKPLDAAAAHTVAPEVGHDDEDKVAHTPISTSKADKDKPIDDTSAQTSMPSAEDITEKHFGDSSTPSTQEDEDILSHTVSPSIEEIEKEPIDDTVAHTERPSTSVDNKEVVDEVPVQTTTASSVGDVDESVTQTVLPQDEDTDKKTIDQTTAHAVVPSLEEAITDEPLDQKILPSTQQKEEDAKPFNEKEIPDKTTDKTVAPSDEEQTTDETLAHSVSPSIQKDEKETKPFDEKETHEETTDKNLASTVSTVPSTGETEKDYIDKSVAHTIAPGVEITSDVPSTDSTQDGEMGMAHTTAASVDNVEKDTADEISTQTISPIVAEEESTDQIMDHNLVPIGEMDEKKPIDETYSHTIDTSTEKDMKEPIDEVMAQTTSSSIGDDMKGTTDAVHISSSTQETEKEQPDDKLTHTVAPSTDESEKEPIDSILPHITAPTEEEIATDGTLPHTTSSPIQDGGKKPSEESLVDTDTPAAQDIDDSHAQTDAPSVVDAEKKPIDETLSHTTDSSVEEEEKGVTDEILAHSTPPIISEMKPTDEILEHTETPITEESEEKPTDDEHTIPSSPHDIDMKPVTQTISPLIETRIDDPLATTPTPSLDDAEKKPTDEMPAQTSAPSVEDDEKETSDESVEHTVAPSIEKEDTGTTDETVTAVTPSQEDTKKESIDESLAPAITTTDDKHEQESIDEDMSHTTDISQTVSPSTEDGTKKPSNESVEHISSTSIPSDEHVAHTTVPSLAEDDKSVAHTVHPTLAAEEKEEEHKPADETLSPTVAPSRDEEEKEPIAAHTAAPSAEDEENVGEETDGTTTSPSDKIPVDKTDLHTSGAKIQHPIESSITEEPTDMERTTLASITTAAQEHAVVQSTITPLDAENPDQKPESMPESETAQPILVLDRTTVAPTLSAKPTHGASVEASLDSTEDSDESMESAEEMTTEHKVQHIGEFVTERIIEGSTTEKTQGSITDSSEISEDEDTATALPPHVIEAEDHKAGVTEEPHLIGEAIVSSTAKPENVSSAQDGEMSEVITTKPHIAAEEIPVESATEGATPEISTQKTESDAEGDQEKEVSSEEHKDETLAATTVPAPPSQPDIAIKPSLDTRIDDSTLTDGEVIEATTAKDEEKEAATEVPSTAASTTTSTTTESPVTAAAPIAQYPPPAPPGYGQPPHYPAYGEDEYTDEDESEVFGPGTCRYGGKLYVSAQQIPRDDPCDFCFCFRSDIICLQQSCPPPISGCHEEPISGFCCPRYECPVSMATVLNITTSTTTTSTTLPPHFLHHSYGGAVQRNGCQINGRSYRVGEKIESTSGPCINCTCGGDGKMKCDPQACVPEPTMQQVMAVVAAGRKR